MEAAEMGFESNIVLNLYSVAILLIIAFQGKGKTGRSTLQDTLFSWILWVTIFMLITDTMGRFDGKPDTFYPLLNHFGNLTVFLLNPIVPALWLMYVYHQVYQSEKRAKRLLIPSGILLAIHTLMVVGTQYYGWFYTIDEQNIYHRGPLYVLSPCVLFVYLFVAVVMVIHKRKGMEKKLYNSLLFFIVPPLVMTILHILIYGVSLALSGLVLSILIVYLNIQNRSLITDHLTGAYNRKGFDMHLREKIRASQRGKAFSAILLDYDHFKSINDTFGHDMGDQALMQSSELLKTCIRHTDFIARFGGDEFVILLDTANKSELEAVVQRIHDAIERYNKENQYPFSIGFSAGYAVYDRSIHQSADDFVRLLDRMMYQMKQA